MRVSINSTYSYIKTNINYGSVLQCYALQQYLLKRGHTPEHIRDCRFNPLFLIKRLRNIKYFRMFCAKVTGIKKEQEFIKNNIAVSKRAYFSEKSMKRHCPKAECFIAGSDQIWRKANGSRFLNYAPDSAIKLSYAASFGRTDIPVDMAQAIRPWLERFDGVSVRENTAVDMVHSVREAGAVRVIDPTLLLDWEEYPYRELKLCDYCYCYFLNLERKENVRFEEIKAYAAQRGKNLLVTAPLNYALFQGEDVVFPAVEDWLGYYKNAECIFTNTFHGMLFCIIFKKQFLFFIQNGNGGKENDRFYSLMSLLHLEDRMVSAEDSIELVDRMNARIDYEKVYEVIRKERKRTDDFFAEYGL